MKIESHDIPNSWEFTTMGEISTVIGGGTPKTKEPDNYEGGSIPWLTPADLSGYSNKIVGHGKRFITEKGLSTSSARMLPKGTVLYTSRAPIGYVAIASNPICTNQGFKSFVLNDGILPDYVYWYLKGTKNLAESFASGTTFLELSGASAKKLPVPIAPENEQKRIVAEIEKQFSRLDEAVENLKRVKANLKRYKASVLKAAVEGKLTEEWRKKHLDVEPADKLLERILVERRKKWEEGELAKMKAKGKEPKDDKWKKKYKEPSQADISTLNELPNGWHWTITDQLFWFVTSGSRGWAKYYSDSGAIFLRIGNLNHNSVSLDLTKIQYVKPPKGAEGMRTRVEENDILVSITADVGMIGVVPRSFEEAYINQHISLARPVSLVNSLYISWYLTSRLGQNQFIVLQRGATKAGLGLDDIRSVNIPMPPFKEQDEILSQIENKLSIVDKIVLEVDENLKHTDRLRQSILKQAFSGKLVKHILGEESASVLLERIGRQRRKGKTQKPAAKKGKRTMTVKDTYLTLEEVDVDHLSKILAKSGLEIDPTDLWEESKLPIDDFYAQLKREVEGNLIEETPERFLKLIA